MVYDTEQTEL